jgi:hypothetical protein
MIHHISIAVHNPLHVSQVMAEILQGQSVPFLGQPGSYIALTGDAHGTLIECYPFGTALIPDEAANESGKVRPNPEASPRYTATHAAISVPISLTQIKAIAAREGWRAVHSHVGKNYFEVVELWVENQLLIELLPLEFVDQYLKFMSPESLQAYGQAATS